MVGLVSTYLEHFTYFGLLIVLVLCGLGLPVPEDAVLLTGGFLAHRGIVEYPVALMVSFVGVITGDCSLFFLGRRFGTGLLRYFGLIHPGSRKSIARMRRFMDRHGHRAVFYGRFLAGLRALVYLSAGSLGVPTSRFLMYDLLGAIISVPLVVSLGYVFGSEIERILHYLGGIQRALLIVAGLSVLIWLTRMMVLAKPEAHRKNAQAEVE
ncbi:MAG TPA: DedA family protein [Candidatus Binataceae bacterium]|nr:DedA family protein [Candidatus Binataceae bacterium]